MYSAEYSGGDGDERGHFGELAWASGLLPLAALALKTQQRFLVWGAGGHGRVVADVITASGHEVLGYIDRNPRVAEGKARNGLVIAEDEVLAGLASGSSLPHGATAVAIGIGDNSRRAELVRSLRNTPSMIHPTAVVSESAVIGDGTVVMAGAVINAAAVIGKAVIVNTGAIIEHDCTVEDGAHVSPGAVLAGAVNIGAQAWVGASAVIIEGIRVGAGAIVGAGAVVLRDVPPGVTVVGNPARPIGQSRDE